MTSIFKFESEQDFALKMPPTLKLYVADENMDAFRERLEKQGLAFQETEIFNPS